MRSFIDRFSTVAIFGVAASLLLVALFILNQKFHWNSILTDQHLASDIRLSSQRTIMFVTGLILISFASITVGFRRLMSLKDETVQRRVLRTQNEAGAYLEVLNAHSMVTVSDADDVIIEANENFLNSLGYDLDEVLGQQSSFIYPYNERDKMADEVRSALQRGNSWIGKQVLLTKSDERLVAQTTISPVFDEQGHIIRFISVRSDITAFENENANVLLGTMLGELQDEVYIYDVETLAIRFANKAACERCEWDENGYTDKTICDTSKYFDVLVFRTHVEPLVQKKRDVLSVELNHEKGPVEIKTRITKTSDGQEVFVSVLRDLDARRKLEKARMESISVISHELRTPLTSIKGSLSLAETGAIGQLPDQVREVLAIASRNADRILTIVNDILDLEKVKANKLKCPKTPVNLSELLYEIVEINKGIGIKRDIELEICDVPEASMVNGNCERLTQILTNILSNAVKYSPSNDKVKLYIGDRQSNWRISILDNGPGIPEEERDNVFTSFGQADSGDGIKREGTGLGLMITKKLVKLHGGNIDFTCSADRGTEFYVDLPKLGDGDNSRISHHSRKLAS